MDIAVGNGSAAKLYERLFIMANQSKAFTALNKFATSREALIQGLIDAGYPTVETARPVVIQWASDKCGAGADGYNTAKSGKIMLNSAHERYEAIKTTVRDVMLMIEGTTRRAKAEASAPKESAKKDHVAVLAAAVLKLSAKDKARFMAMAQL